MSIPAEANSNIGVHDPMMVEPSGDAAAGQAPANHEHRPRREPGPRIKTGIPRCSMRRGQKYQDLPDIVKSGLDFLRHSFSELTRSRTRYGRLYRARSTRVQPPLPRRLVERETPAKTMTGTEAADIATINDLQQWVSLELARTRRHINRLIASDGRGVAAADAAMLLAAENMEESAEEEEEAPVVVVLPPPPPPPPQPIPLPNEYQCSICFSGFEGDPSQHGICCHHISEDNPEPVHFICSTCFTGYIVSCSGNGNIENEVFNSSGVASGPGHVPCPMFHNGVCNDASLDHMRVLEQVGSDVNANREYNAISRRAAVAMYRIEEEQERQRAIQAAAATAVSPVMQAMRIVQGALTAGSSVPCPRCNIPTRKDDACIHMSCTCGCLFCYGCGFDRFSQYPPSGRNPEVQYRVHCGCDAVGIHLQSRPGWTNLDRPGETRGMGALMEFHRRRMAYFVRMVKFMIDPDVWTQLRQQHPDMLQDVIGGRSITWDEIDTAEYPPIGNHQRAKDSVERLKIRLIQSLVVSD